MYFASISDVFSIFTIPKLQLFLGGWRERNVGAKQIIRLVDFKEDSTVGGVATRCDNDMVRLNKVAALKDFSSKNSPASSNLRITVPRKTVW
jgi:hypothetical protein